MGFIFQDFNLFDNLNVYDNIALCMKIVQRRKKEDIKKNIDDLLNLVNLTGKEKSYPSQLSGGERQRVAAARALINNPSIILADEPSGSLDSNNKQELHRLLCDMRDQFNQTIVIVTHDNELAQIANRIVKMQDGRIIS